MNDRRNPLLWTLPAGRWFSVQVRISPLFLLLLIPLWSNCGFELGTILGLVLFVSIIIHEAGHVLAARLTGGMADEIVLWPLGGLAPLRLGPGLFAGIMTPMAGPLTNLILCAIALPAVLSTGNGVLAAALDPLTLPISEFNHAQWMRDLLILTFATNWILLLVNLLPVPPLDAAQAIEAFLAQRVGREVAHHHALKIGSVCGFLIMLLGLIFSGVWLTFLGGLLLAMNLSMMLPLAAGESYDDSFMGYDFSQGYTSLERSLEDAPPPSAGIMTRWKESRQRKRQERQQQQLREAEQQLDELLEKVHRDGMDSLSDAERRQLKRVSSQLRDRQK